MFNNWDNSDGCSKEKGKHTEWGEIYHASYVVITITAIILSIINWDKIAYLFYVAIFLFICDLWIPCTKNVGKIGSITTLEVC